MPSAVPADVQAAIIAEYLAGAHTGALATSYGWSPSTLHRIYREAGIKADRRRSGQASWVKRTGLPPDDGTLEGGFRWCSDCRERKPMDDFYWMRSRTRGTQIRKRRCKSCHYIACKARANLRANRRKYLYGMSAEDYDRMLAEQGEACAICREPAADDDGRGLHVDHDHASGAVRGLLCGNCNQGLGRFRDNPDYLHAAASYLERQGLDSCEFPVRIVDPIGQTYLAARG
jgi:hypothetical protein